VGIVEAVGPGCLDVAEGDWVVPIRDGLGTFSSLGVWDIKNFLKVPKELMPLEYMALHRELALAYYLMETVRKPETAISRNHR
jgi:trans-2-enoyl-CoA reductase